MSIKSCELFNKIQRDGSPSKKGRIVGNTTLKIKKSDIVQAETISPPIT